MLTRAYCAKYHQSKRMQQEAMEEKWMEGRPDGPQSNHGDHPPTRTDCGSPSLVCFLHGYLDSPTF